MNLIKRAYYSLINNRSKTIVLFLIVFILGNVMCGALAISQSINNAQSEFQKHYGAKINITLTKPTFEIMMTNESSKTKYINIKDYFENLIGKRTDMIAYQDCMYAIDGITSDDLYYEDERYSYIEKAERIHLIGVTNANNGNLKNYKIELIEGRTFNDSEMKEGSQVIMISNNFQYENGDKVKIGDKLTFKRENMSEAVYEVIGIFKRYDNVMIEPNGEGYQYDNHMAQIYTPYETLSKEEKESNQSLLLFNISLQLNEPEDLNVFNLIIDKLKEDKPNIHKNINVISTNDIYKKISAPIESMSGIANFLIIMSSCLCTMILSVAIFIIIRNRKHEIGILISLGEHKRNVILQIMIEILLVGLLALSSSLVTGNKLGELYSNYLVSDQIEMSKDDLTVNESELQEELLEIYSFDLRTEYIISVLTIGTTILLLSVVIPIGYIANLKPRKIML